MSTSLGDRSARISDGRTSSGWGSLFWNLGALIVLLVVVGWHCEPGQRPSSAIGRTAEAVIRSPGKMIFSLSWSGDCKTMATAGLETIVEIRDVKCDPTVDALIEQAVAADTREKLTVACKCIDRVLRGSHYWVPMWNKGGHNIAYWDLFGRPARPARYGLNAVSTWWYDEAKADKTALRPR